MCCRGEDKESRCGAWSTVRPQLGVGRGVLEGLKHPQNENKHPRKLTCWDGGAKPHTGIGGAHDFSTPKI